LELLQLVPKECARFLISEGMKGIRRDKAYRSPGFVCDEFLQVARLLNLADRHHYVQCIVAYAQPGEERYRQLYQQLSHSPRQPQQVACVVPKRSPDAHEARIRVEELLREMHGAGFAVDERLCRAIAVTMAADPSPNAGESLMHFLNGMEQEFGSAPTAAHYTAGLLLSENPCPSHATADALEGLVGRLRGDARSRTTSTLAFHFGLTEGVFAEVLATWNRSGLPEQELKAAAERVKSQMAQNGIVPGSRLQVVLENLSLHGAKASGAPRVEAGAGAASSARRSGQHERQPYIPRGTRLTDLQKRAVFRFNRLSRDEKSALLHDKSWLYSPLPSAKGENRRANRSLEAVLKSSPEGIAHLMQVLRGLGGAAEGQAEATHAQLEELFDLLKSTVKRPDDIPMKGIAAMLAAKQSTVRSMERALQRRARGTQGEGRGPREVAGRIEELAHEAAALSEMLLGRRDGSYRHVLSAIDTLQVAARAGSPTAGWAAASLLGRFAKTAQGTEVPLPKVEDLVFRCLQTLRLSLTTASQLESRSADEKLQLLKETMAACYEVGVEVSPAWYVDVALQALKTDESARLHIADSHDEKQWSRWRELKTVAQQVREISLWRPHVDHLDSAAAEQAARKRWIQQRTARDLISTAALPLLKASDDAGVSVAVAVASDDHRKGFWAASFATEEPDFIHAEGLSQGVKAIVDPVLANYEDLLVALHGSRRTSAVMPDGATSATTGSRRVGDLEVEDLRCYLDVLTQRFPSLAANSAASDLSFAPTPVWQHAQSFLRQLHASSKLQRELKLKFLEEHLRRFLAPDVHVCNRWDTEAETAVPEKSVSGLPTSFWHAEQAFTLLSELWSAGKLDKVNAHPVLVHQVMDCLGSHSGWRHLVSLSSWRCASRAPFTSEQFGDRYCHDVRLQPAQVQLFREEWRSAIQRMVDVEFVVPSRSVEDRDRIRITGGAAAIAKAKLYMDLHFFEKSLQTHFIDGHEASTSLGGQAPVDRRTPDVMYEVFKDAADKLRDEQSLLSLSESAYHRLHPSFEKLAKKHNVLIFNDWNASGSIMEYSPVRNAWQTGVVLRIFGEQENREGVVTAIGSTQRSWERPSRSGKLNLQRLREDSKLYDALVRASRRIAGDWWASSALSSATGVLGSAAVFPPSDVTTPLPLPVRGFGPSWSLESGATPSSPSSKLTDMEGSSHGSDSFDRLLLKVQSLPGGLPSRAKAAQVQQLQRLAVEEFCSALDGARPFSCVTHHGEGGLTSHTLDAELEKLASRLETCASIAAGIDGFQGNQRAEALLLRGANRYFRRKALGRARHPTFSGTISNPEEVWRSVQQAADAFQTLPLRSKADREVPGTLLALRLKLRRFIALDALRSHYPSQSLRHVANVANVASVANVANVANVAKVAKVAKVANTADKAQFCADMRRRARNEVQDAFGESMLLLRSYEDAGAVITSGHYGIIASALGDYVRAGVKTGYHPLLRGGRGGLGTAYRVVPTRADLPGHMRRRLQKEHPEGVSNIEMLREQMREAGRCCLALEESMKAKGFVLDERIRGSLLESLSHVAGVFRQGYDERCLALFREYAESSAPRAGEVEEYLEHLEHYRLCALRALANSKFRPNWTMEQAERLLDEAAKPTVKQYNEYLRACLHGLYVETDDTLKQWRRERERTALLQKSSAEDEVVEDPGQRIDVMCFRVTSCLDRMRRRGAAPDLSTYLAIFETLSMARSQHLEPWEYKFYGSLKRRLRGLTKELVVNCATDLGLLNQPSAALEEGETQRVELTHAMASAVRRICPEEYFHMLNVLRDGLGPLPVATYRTAVFLENLFDKCPADRLEHARQLLQWIGEDHPLETQRSSLYRSILQLHKEIVEAYSQMGEEELAREAASFSLLPGVELPSNPVDGPSGAQIGDAAMGSLGDVDGNDFAEQAVVEWHDDELIEPHSVWADDDDELGAESACAPRRM